MPRRKKGVRLWLRPPRKDRSGRIIAQPTYVILDGTRQVATRCTASQTSEAEQLLAAYIAASYRPPRKRRELEEIDIADVLSIYLDAVLPKLREREGVAEANEDASVAVRRFKARLGRLNDFWGGKMLSDVTGEACRDFCAQRSAGGARRDLEDLSAAIGHHLQEGYHREIVKVTLPSKGLPRDRWLSRDEAAALLWTCWRYQEVQRRHRGRQQGERLPTAKYPLRHLARFVLIGLYTGTRATAIAAASPKRAEGRAFVDLEAGIYYRLAGGKRQTNKRQPPVPLPARLLAHLRRWQRLGIANDFFIEWAGRPVASVKTAMTSAVRLAGLSTEHGNVTPHTLRHTAATWLMQNGAPLWEAAGFLGMSEKTLRETYGHHHPDYMRGAVEAMGRNRRPPGKIGKSLAQREQARTTSAQVSEKSGGPGRTRTSNQTVMSGRL